MPKKNKKIGDSKIIIYNSKDGEAKLEVRLENETVWLSQKQMAELFDCSADNISLHLKNIFKEAELSENSVTEKYSATASDGKNYKVKHYNLEAIISVGYRVNSSHGTQFRIWATQKLKEYVIKGFTMDDERLKQGGKWARYFEELLQRIRDIRSSERNFYQKVADIYATSIDYKKDKEMTQKFFSTVQNKIHYAVHGQTAAEMIAKRTDSKKPLMGLTNFKGDYITANDIAVAKNYLSENELKKLNLIVSLYLDFAELQAVEEIPMKMADWIKKLDEFLKASEKKLLNNAGKMSHEQAMEKADAEFEKYKKEQDKNYISDFDREVKKYLKKKDK
ncbi:virulence RhuM family protein [Patescibacteria group bacterium]|nr:virulence RhuM family protein [Patescibacteria group bacterium]MBU4369305.1 virulence RhuM family protein [Patescibacteria group bacterium]